jgi:hypothetical protein
MKKQMLILAAAALPFAGCDAPDSSLVIHGIIVPMEMVEMDMVTMQTSRSCLYDPMSDVTAVRVVIDVAQQLSLYLVLKVENTLQPNTIMIDTEPDQAIAYNESVSPLRFDYRWECDTIGFGSDLGPLFVPQFSVNQPFCLDSRDETSGDFVGFDVIPATGGAIPAGGTGGVEIRPIPAQLGLALYDMFTLAALAQACCMSTEGCSGVESGVTMECARLQSLFNDVGILQNQVEAAQRYRPFALFDGSVPPTNMFPSNTYPLRLRGVLEGVTSSGTTVTSNEWAQDIGIGRNLDIVAQTCFQ